jgi:hypothetical protein
MAGIGIPLMCSHPMYTQANMMNRKNPNTAMNMMMAKVATNKINKLTIVPNIRMVPPLVLINQVLVRVCVRI